MKIQKKSNFHNLLHFYGKMCKLNERQGVYEEGEIFEENIQERNGRNLRNLESKSINSEYFDWYNWDVIFIGSVFYLNVKHLI